LNVNHDTVVSRAAIFVCCVSDFAVAVVVVVVFNFTQTNHSICLSTTARWSVTVLHCARSMNARKTTTDFSTWSTRRRRRSAEVIAVSREIQYRLRQTVIYHGVVSYWTAVQCKTLPSVICCFRRLLISYVTRRCELPWFWTRAVDFSK